MKLLLIVTASSLLAQDPAPKDPAGFTMWKTSELNDRVREGRVDATGMGGGGIGNLAGYNAIVVHRNKTGEAESHERFGELMIVTEGEATLRVGGTVTETRENSPGEVRGKSMTGGVEKRVVAGDMIHLPPGMTHWVVLAEGKQVTYFLLKLDKK